MCRQDALEAITSEGSSWSRARQIEILRVNMLSFQIFMSDEKGIQALQKDSCTIDTEIEVREDLCRK